MRSIYFLTGILRPDLLPQQEEEQVAPFDYEQARADFKDYQLNQSQQQLTQEGLEALL